MRNTNEFDDTTVEAVSFFAKPLAKKLYWSLGAIFLVVILGSNSYFQIPQSERGYIRTFGAADKAQLLAPGWHFKAPFFSTADTLQVSQTTLKVDEFYVNTVDNQQIELAVDIQYRIPESDVYRLLYEVGRTGTADISDPIRDIVKDRVSRIFSSKNTNSISENRERIQEDTQAFVDAALKENFGIELRSLQISKIKFSDTFVQSNNTAVLAKNQAIQEENRLKVSQYQAQQQVIGAQGLRDQQVAAAEGRNKAAILEAEAQAKSVELQATAAAHAKTISVEAAARAQLVQADSDKKSLVLRGEGESTALKLQVDAMGGPTNYIEKERVSIGKNWGGNVPQQFISSDKLTSWFPQVPGMTK